jgi:Ca2+-binding EF-hand superfamily protein
MASNRAKEKTQSFTYSKNTPKNQQSSQVSISPEKSEKRSANPHEYADANRKRFIRKPLDKDQNFNPRMYISNDVNEEDVIDLKEVFDTYDSTEMGVLLPNDIKLFLQQNGFEPNKKTVYEIVAEFDIEETGGISFADFMEAMKTKPLYNETKKDIAAIFRRYDRNGKGYIDLEDLREVNRHVKENLDDETLKMILKKADSNLDNKITFEDFYSVMVRQVK